MVKKFLGWVVLKMLHFVWLTTKSFLEFMDKLKPNAK